MTEFKNTNLFLSIFDVATEGLRSSATKPGGRLLLAADPFTQVISLCSLPTF